MSSIPPPMQVIPVTPTYAVPSTSLRPAGLTAVGVISIILGIVGILANISTAGFSAMTLLTATVQQMTASRFDASRYPLMPVATSNSPHGLPEAKALAVVDGLNRTRPLSMQRQEHVKSLALNYGQKLFAFTTDSFTATRVRANITDSGPLLLGGGQNGDFYVTGTGRIEVSNASAVFRSDDGDVYRSGDVTVDDSLTEADISTFLTHLKGMGVSPNSSQEATIQRLLRDPTQQVVTKSDPSFASMPINFAGPLEKGGIWFRTSNAQVRIEADGVETLLSSQAPIPGLNPFTGKRIRTFWGQMLLLECLASGLVAILLLIAGVFVLRGRPAGRKMLLIFGSLKLPLAILGAVLLGFTVAEWMGALRSEDTQNPPPIMAGALTSAILIGIAGLVWPIIVLITMTRKSVKEYFHGVV